MSTKKEFKEHEKVSGTKGTMIRRKSGQFKLLNYDEITRPESRSNFKLLLVLISRLSFNCESHSLFGRLFEANTLIISLERYHR